MRIKFFPFVSINFVLFFTISASQEVSETEYQKIRLKNNLYALNQRAQELNKEINELKKPTINPIKLHENIKKLKEKEKEAEKVLMAITEIQYKISQLG